MRKIIFCFSFLICMFGQAQTSVNSGSGNISSQEAFMSYSIGQVFYQTVASGGISVAEGIHQSFIIYTTGWLNATLTAEVYPNPVTDRFILSIHDNVEINFTARFVDMTGKIIKTVSVTEQETQFNVESLPAAVYFLHVIDGSQVIRTFKIIKQ